MFIFHVSVNNFVTFRSIGNIATFLIENHWGAVANCGGNQESLSVINQCISISYAETIFIWFVKYKWFHKNLVMQSFICDKGFLKQWNHIFHGNIRWICFKGVIALNFKQGLTWISHPGWYSSSLINESTTNVPD